MSWRKRIVALLGVVALGVTVLAGPAGAAAVSAADRRGDGVGPGDMRAVKLENHSDVLTIRVRTEHPINLAASPAWHRAGSQTLLRVFLDTNPSSPGPDYVVVLKAATGEISTAIKGLIEATPRDGCIPSIGQPQPTIIQIAFGSFCLSGNGTVRAYASYRFDQGGDGSIQSFDRAPNAGFGPRLQLVH
jgi:hypothetical protein